MFKVLLEFSHTKTDSRFWMWSSRNEKWMDEINKFIEAETRKEEKNLIKVTV